MDLAKLYELRADFTIIGVTGRTGSGCTKVAEILSKPDQFRSTLIDPNQIKPSIFKQKYSACYNYLVHGKNLQQFEVIYYKDVLLFYIVSQIGDDDKLIRRLLIDYYRIEEDVRYKDIDQVLSGISEIKQKHSAFIQEIEAAFKSTEDNNWKPYKLFFDPRFKEFKTSVFTLLEKESYMARTNMLHWVSCNIRGSGNPLISDKQEIKNIYSIAEYINKIIKAWRKENIGKPTKFVIDSLRNSLEIMFFKERYSGFYMVATKDFGNKASERIEKRLTDKGYQKKVAKTIATELLELDDTEYRAKDFRKGIFSSPDVINCIQKSDIHIVNRTAEDLQDAKSRVEEEKSGDKDSGRVNGIRNDQRRNSILNFYTIEEQLLKYVSLISQPGIVTPTHDERCMKIAHTAKLNSGCISRQVGAVVTDSNSYVKGIGWNDVPKGVTPCKYRNVDDLLNDNETQNYSDFERSESDAVNQSDYKYKNKKPKDFKEAIEFYFGEKLKEKKGDLNGKNCSFCFKTVHNFYEGERNQVHTKSLHAEENAMLQISKFGGQGLVGGKLYTTASPCELCAKKAYQLGVTEVFFIDPYPGISNAHVLKGGKDVPKMTEFSGVIGKSYDKLYEPFMSYKDEIQLMLELKPKKRERIILDQIEELVDDKDLRQILRESKLSNEEIQEKLKEALKNEKEAEK